MKKNNVFTVLSFLLTAVLLLNVFEEQIAAQQTGPPGIQFVMVSFDQPPSFVSVEKAALRYNKSFALSFHTDDGIADVFTVGFPFLTGINTEGTNYPGLFYTDGCGNDISFKLSNALFSFSGFNNEDMHQPGNFYNAVSWPQLALMYQNGCGIYNHGFTSDAFTAPDYMSYSIRRNESFIRRRLFNVAPGGVRTRVFVNPNGVTDYTPAAFQQGYRMTLRMGAFGILPDNGGDVNAVANWTQNLELNRVLAESVNVQQLADQLASSSTGGVNKWMPVFTHRIVEDYPQNSFFADFNYIAETYGKNGLDNIWMATEEEIVNYLVVREKVAVNHIVNGNTLLISFSGQVPGNLRYYPLSLVINADANITGITINGGSGNTYSDLGQSNALINLSWDGSILPDIVTEVEENVSYAEQNPTEYNALIAMDFVLMLPDGPEKEAFRQRLCDIEGVNYEAGFCADCSFSLGADFEICAGSCSTLEAPDFGESSYIWSTGETTRMIEVCPEITSEYWVQLITAEGCVASDTLTIFTIEAPLFDLGDDLTACQGEAVTIEGPNLPQYSFQWFVDGTLLPEATTSSLEIMVTDTLMVKLIVTGANGCSRADSLHVFAWDVPEITISPSSADLCLGENLSLNASVLYADSFQWWNGTNQTETSFTATETGLFYLWLNAVNGYGCTSSDTAFVTVHPEPVFSLDFFQGNPFVCSGETITLVADFSSTPNVEKLVWNTTDTVLVNGQEQLLRAFEMTESMTISATAITIFGCTYTTELNVAVEPLPEITVSEDTAVCFGSAVTLQANGGIACSWFSNGILLSESYDLELIPEQTAYYQALITGQSPSFCQATDSVMVIVYPKPEITIQASETTVCAGTVVNLTADGAQSYTWDNGMIGSPINVFPMSDTVYTVIGISEDGCGDSAAVAISVLPFPEAILSGLLPAYCQNDDAVIMNGLPEGGIYSGPGVAQNLFDPSVAGGGMHHIVYSVEGENGCFGRDTVLVRVLPFELTINLGPDTTICPHDSIVLDAGEGFAHYFWSNGAISQVVTIKGKDYATGMTHQIQVAGTLNGCSATGSLFVTVRDDCYIGLNEIFEHTPLVVVPNPSEGFFQLFFNEDFNTALLQVLDMSGSVVWERTQKQHLKKGDVLSVQLNLNPGNYLLIINTSERKIAQKLLVR